MKSILALNCREAVQLSAEIEEAHFFRQAYKIAKSLNKSFWIITTCGCGCNKVISCLVGKNESDKIFILWKKFHNEISDEIIPKIQDLL